MRTYQTPPPRATPRTITLAQDRATAETELIARVLASPGPGAIVAGEAGIEPDHFGQDDTRILFCAAMQAAEDDLSKPAVLKLARNALRAECLWDDSQIAANALTCMRHSDASLARLASCRPWSPTSIRRAAQALLHVVARQVVAAHMEAKR